MNVIAGPLPCSGCRQLVVYARPPGTYDWRNPGALRKGPAPVAVFPSILDHPAATTHACTGPDIRPAGDHLTITWRRYA